MYEDEFDLGLFIFQNNLLIFIHIFQKYTFCIGQIQILNDCLTLDGPTHQLVIKIKIKNAKNKGNICPIFFRQKSFTKLIVFFKQRRHLNHGPIGLQPIALPLSYIPIC